MGLDPAAIEAAVHAQHARRPFSGVVQVRSDGRVVYAAAFGEADRAGHVANTTSTRFGTASGTKTFTSVAVCQLIDDGALSLDTRLVEAVDHPFPRFDPAITVEHLLTHTSGAPDYFDEDELDAQADFRAAFGDLPLDEVRRPADILPLFADLPMKDVPGARFHYNNGGFVLLGSVVESAGRMPYADFVEERVFARAGMADAGFFELDALPARTALGYLPDGRANSTELTVRGMPDGGAYVTASDMAAFWDALLEGRLLSREMTGRLLEPRVLVPLGDDDGTHYGYGLWVSVADDAVWRWNCTGADPGVAFASARYPHERADITVLGNTDTDAWPLFATVEQLIRA